MKTLFLILSLLPLALIGRSVEVASTDITLQSAQAGLAITDGGKWFINVDRIKFDKRIGGDTYTLYPDGDDPDNVLAAKAAVLTSADTYISEAIEGGFYAVASGGDGYVLTAATSFDYGSICVDEGNICHVYTRQNNTQYKISLFPNGNETLTSARAKDALLGQLSLIETQVNTDRKFK